VTIFENGAFISCALFNATLDVRHARDFDELSATRRCSCSHEKARRARNSSPGGDSSFQDSSHARHPAALQQLDPTNALAYSKMGNYQKVLEDSNKAIELDPNNALGYINRSFANIKLGNYRGAIQDAIRALELDPGNALCYANRGDAHYNLGNYEKAISDYKTGARIGQEGCQRVLRSMGISW
jgi:tetratricopeptide (TPR) repeat protein